MAINLLDRMGIQSWCFRSIKTHDGVIDALKQCGVKNIELCGAHYKPEVENDHAKIVADYKKKGVTVSSFGVVGIGTDEAKARKVFDFAKAAGFKTISADLAPGGLEVAEKLCKEYNKKIAIHNHGRKHALGSVKALDELFAKASTNVGLCMDTAWMLDSGENPVEIAKKFANRLYGIHLKDFIFKRDGKPEDVVIGQGNLDLKAYIETLLANNFDGYFTLEYEGDVETPIPATKKCVEAVTAMLKKCGAAG
ncbi:MAG TPA: sugar phosphate isomerase/epimerase [Planctomycetota bacterium]|nr:sugar phosphate isomerase/epimerase [Planctomycetota bacterium]